MGWAIKQNSGSKRIQLQVGLIFVRTFHTLQILKKATFHHKQVFVHLLIPNPISLHSSGAAVDHSSGSVTGINLVPVLSRFPSQSLQVSPNPLPAAVEILRPRCPFRVATFNVRPRIHAG